MPRQLIYTSAPRGLTPGQSGYCTVARSRDLREGLIPRLEKFSYYAPETKGNPVICAHRIIELRGVRYHALSRIVDAGLDFTKRRNFLAHHLVFDPADLEGAPSPAWFFLKWNGWMNQWEGDSHFISDVPIPHSMASAGRGVLQPADVFVTGTEEERKQFLKILDETLSACAKPWEVTFTNCFQPGDLEADFRLKAVWPGTAGHELAVRSGDKILPLSVLKAIPPREEPMPAAAPRPAAAPEETPVSPRRRHFSWPMIFGVTTALGVSIGLMFHRQPQKPETISYVAVKPVSNPAPIPHPTAAAEMNLDEIFPPIPTWIAASDSGALGAAPALEKMFRLLHDSELFGKDIRALLQTNSFSKPVSAQVDAQPQENRIRFRAGAVELNVEIVNGIAGIRSNAQQPVALEINSQRFLSIPENAPLMMSQRFLVISTNAQTVALSSDLETRVRQALLPAGAQLALRPKDDPIAKVEKEFALLPATFFDLRAIRTQAHQVVTAREKDLEALRAELNKLKAVEKKLLTEERTREEAKRKDRIAALELAVPRAAHELKELREKAATIPKDVAKIEKFSLFLCLSNVNTEIIRFGGEPNLARNGRP